MHRVSPFFAPGCAIARGLEAAGAGSRLTHFEINVSTVGLPWASALGRALAAQGPRGALRELDLSYTNLGPEEAIGLAEGIRVCLSLETLILHGNDDIGPRGVAAIASAISGTGTSASNLKTLNVSRTEIGDEGVAAMLQAGLGRNSSLTRLDVSGNGLGDQGCMALARWAEARFFPPHDSPAHHTRSQSRAAAGPSAGAGGLAALGSTRPGKKGLHPDDAIINAAPLTVIFDETEDDEFDNEVSAAVEASIRGIMDRVNAAADAAGRRRDALGRPALTLNV